MSIQPKAGTSINSKVSPTGKLKTAVKYFVSRTLAADVEITAQISHRFRASYLFRTTLHSQ
jgi:hypothetical protein